MMSDSQRVEAPVVLEELGIRYGRRRVIDSVSLRVEPGQVYALLGRNGEGKSSLVRCLLGWQRPSEGRAQLLGQEAWAGRDAAMNRVGVVQESPEIPRQMKVGEALRFCGALHAVWDEKGVLSRLSKAGVPLEANAGTLSKGQRAQLALALALGHRPELLVLDDPTLGLDAVARRTFYETLVTELADRGVAVLLTTHDLAGVEGVADRVGILRDCRLILDEALETMKHRVRRMRWKGAGPSEGLLKELQVLRREEAPWGGEALVAGYREESLARFGDGEAQAWDVESVALEDAFIALVDGNREVRA